MTKVAGVGRHEDWVKSNNPTQIVRWAQLVLVFEFFHFAGVALPKLAILFFYIRVFNWKGRMQMICYTLMGMLVAVWLGSSLAACLQCRPLAFWWDRSIRGGTCFDVQTFFRGQAITSPILDAVILLLPMRSIWSLQLPERKRIELILVFGVAGFGVIASIVRVQIFFDTAAFADRTCWCPYPHFLFQLLSGADVQTGASVDLCGWSIIEVGTYVITACLPALRPLVPFFTPRRLLAKARNMMTIPNGGHSSPTSKAPQSDIQQDFPSLVTRNSITQGQFKDCGPWDGPSQNQSTEEPRGGQNDEEGPHEESYKEEVSERINWESDGILTILVTRTTSVTVDRLGAFDRPWEYLGPSIGSPTIRSG